MENIIIKITLLDFCTNQNKTNTYYLRFINTMPKTINEKIIHHS